MRIVVGVQPDPAGDDALACAEALSRSMRADLVLCHVHPTPWQARDRSAVDSEWLEFLVEESREALARASALLPPDVHCSTQVQAHSSTGRGLAEVAQEQGAALVVIGSAPGGRPGLLHGGSTADQLLHGSPVPVVVVPHGLREQRPAVPTRLTVAYQRALDSEEAVRAAVQLNERTAAQVRLVTLVVQPPRTMPSYERALDDLRRDALVWLEDAAEEVPRAALSGTELAEGPDLEHAMAAVDLEPGELLVVGSAPAGPLQRVFLDEPAAKILRVATTPVLVVPRTAEPELDHTRAIPRVAE